MLLFALSVIGTHSEQPGQRAHSGPPGFRLVSRVVYHLLRQNSAVFKAGGGVLHAATDQECSTHRWEKRFHEGGGLAVGVLAAEGCAVSRAATTSTTRIPRSASFGWEVANLNGNGANAYFNIPIGMVLNSVNIDVSAMPVTITGAGFAEVLCYGGISRQAVPTLDNSGGHDYIGFALSSDFGPVTIANPNNLSVAYDGTLSQDKFVSVILKTWVPSDGTASATARNVTAYPSLTLNSGDYLVFHIDHAGISVDAEMQVVINYTPT